MKIIVERSRTDSKIFTMDILRPYGRFQMVFEDWTSIIYINAGVPVFSVLVSSRKWK